MTTAPANPHDCAQEDGQAWPWGFIRPSKASEQEREVASQVVQMGREHRRNVFEVAALKSKEIAIRFHSATSSVFLLPHFRHVD